MARFVTFPGVAGAYVSTEDINLLDADTAHLEQGTGLWAGFFAITGVGVLVSTSDSGVSPTFGSQLMEMTCDGSNEPWARIQPAPDVFAPGDTVSQMYSVVASVVNRESRLVANWRTVADGSISDSTTPWIPVSDAVFTDIALTAVAPALAVRSQTRVEYRVAGGGAPANGEKFGIDSCIQRIGSDASFVPSLDIVGVLDEVLDPPGFPVAYVKAQDLRLGVSYTGDIIDYQRLDGVGGPIVAQFSADDIGI